MGRYNKGQQALEYLVTYGWAFVVVLLTIGSFAYFGSLSPQKYLPDRCSFGEQLQCVDYLLTAIDGEKGTVSFKFTNNFGVDIRILDIETVETWGDFCDGSLCPAGGGFYVEVPNGRVNTEAVILDLDVTENLDYILLDGEKASIPIHVTFSRNVTGAPVHVVIGEVFATEQDIN